MSHRNESSRKHRKSRYVKKDQHYPAVSFDGSESVDIPYDAGKSPVSTRLSFASNPADFNFMDEIALLKRGRIDKDAPKHPYNRRGQPPPNQEISVTSSRSSKSVLAKSPAILTLMGGETEKEKVYDLQDGQLKISRMKGGGKKYDVTVSSTGQFIVFSQTAGQTCLFCF